MHSFAACMHVYILTYVKADIIIYIYIPAASQSRLEQIGLLDGQDEQEEPDWYGRPLTFSL